MPCAPSWPPGVQPELLRVTTSTDAPHFSPAWFWGVCVHTSCPNSFVSGLQPRHPDLSSSQHQRCLPEPSIQGRRPSVISTQRGCRGRAAAERFQASGQSGPGGGELVTGSQMLETKRTCRHTPHSSIPPFKVGPFPGAYVLFPSDCKRLFLTMKYVPSAPRMIGAAPTTGGGDEWTVRFRKGLSHLKNTMPLLGAACILPSLCPSIPTQTPLAHLNTTLAHKQTSL